MVAVSAGADTRAEAASCSSSLPFPGFPGRAAPPPVVQTLVASIEPLPALCAPSEAFSRGCSLPPPRTSATKQLCVQMSPELISVTG